MYADVSIYEHKSIVSKDYGGWLYDMNINICRQ